MTVTEALKGKTILIGRENSPLSRLFISADAKALALNLSVPKNVSRCLPAEGKAHCKIEISHNGELKITNLKDENRTYVNGNEIISKIIKPTDTVELGESRFAINIQQILNAATKLVTVAPPQPDGYSIKHLENVWNDFENKNIELQKRAKHLNLLRSVPIAFTMIGGVISAIVDEDIRKYTIIITCIAVVILLYGLYKAATDKSIEERQEATKKFQDNYVCPKCRHFLGNQPYNIVRQNKNCPYCKVRFI